MKEKNSFSVLENLARLMGCEYLSDLKYLTEDKRGLLAGFVRNLDPEAATADEWNDALRYLTGQPPQPDAASARQALLRGLETFP